MDIKKLKEKAKLANNFEEAEELLTKDEMVRLLIDNYDMPYKEGDECCINMIMVVLSIHKSSIQHSLDLLEVTKSVLLELGRFNY